jgi:hypothetical protein
LIRAITGMESLVDTKKGVGTKSGVTKAKISYQLLWRSREEEKRDQRFDGWTENWRHEWQLVLHMC